ncbi:MAG TPA: hypothetical protein DCZ92_09385 [Elusimicrobia bacterium]|nr:MAG: hypothetical protein A2016_11340 [Elusimicrobia bacterium GWF2_62_30]HBA61014.1 hypothetical protein [Elusimicrobiota bacterium]
MPIPKSLRLSLDGAISLTLGLFALSVIFSVTIVEGALFLALILLLVKKYRERTLKELKAEVTGHPLFLPWMGYLAICLLTSLTAYYPAKGFGQLNSDFLKYLCVATLLLGIKKEHLPRLSVVYTVAAFFAAIYAISEVTGANMAGLTMQRTNAFMNAIRYSEVMTIAFMFILSRLIIPGKMVFKGEHLFYGIAAVPVFISLIMSQARGSYLGLMVGIAAMLYFCTPSRKKMAAYAAIMITVASLMIGTNPEMRDRLTAVANAKQGDFSPNTPQAGINIRKALWKIGFTMIKAHPVLGVGPDNIKPVFKKFYEGIIGEQKAWGSLHNLYIHQAAERGLPGLAALLFLFWAMFDFARRRFREVRSAYTLWAVCVLPAFYAVNLTEISFQHVHTSFAVFLALAFSAASEKAE